MTTARKLTRHRGNIITELREERLKWLEHEKHSNKEDAETKIKLEKARAEEQRLLSQLHGEQRARQEAIHEKKQLELRAIAELKEQKRQEEGSTVLDLHHQNLFEVPLVYRGRENILKLQSAIEVNLRGNHIKVRFLASFQWRVNENTHLHYGASTTAPA